MNIEPIAYFQSPLTSKFGVPRQSGLVESLPGRIVLTAPYREQEALRGLEEYDYVWIIWGFSMNVSAEKHATVRPPVLGGNERWGVWATRSPFRPNNLGLSSVRLVKVNHRACTIDVEGADLTDGTPIYDIKPYLPYADSHAEARGGIADHHEWQRLKVVIPQQVQDVLSADDCRLLEQLLALDPRPRYHRNPERIYGMPFRCYDVNFKVEEETLYVVDLVKNEE